MNKKEIATWALLALLTVSNISLHMRGSANRNRMHGITERMSGMRGSWAGKQEGRERVRPERVMPEGRKGKKDKTK